MLPTILDAPTILMVTIEILDFWGYWRFLQQIFYTLPTILDAPTILNVTIDLLDIWGYPKVFYPPTILMATIEF